MKILSKDYILIYKPAVETTSGLSIKKGIKNFAGLCHWLFE